MCVSKRPSYGLAIALLLACVLLAPLVTQANHSTLRIDPFNPNPINTSGQPSGSINTRLRESLDHEAAQLHGERSGPFIVSGGLHGTAAGLTSAAFATIAQVPEHVNQTATAITYAAIANDVCWTIISSDNNGITGWTRVGTTAYYYQCEGDTTPTQPTLPANSTWLSVSTITGSAIFAVTDLRRLHPSMMGLRDACAYASLDAAVTAASTTRTTMIVDCPLWVDAATVTVPATMGIEVTGRGQLIATSPKTIQFNGPFQAPDQVVFDANVSPQFAILEQVHVRWFGTTSAAVQRAITAATTTGATNGNATVYYGAGLYLLDTTITVSTANRGISFVCAHTPSAQNGSVRPITVLRWTGGAGNMFTISNTFNGFYGCGVENFGTAATFVRYTAQGGRDRYDRISIINGSGTTAFSDAAIRYDSGTDYSRYTNIEAGGSFTIFIKYFGTGTTLSIEDSVFDAASDYIVVSMQDGANADVITLRNNTFNSQVNAEALAFDSSSISTGVVNVVSFTENEVDVTSSVPTDRVLKLYNVRNAYIEANEIDCGGSLAYFADVANTTLFSKANRLNSCGPMYQFTSNTSQSFFGGDRFSSNTSGLTDSLFTGVINVTYSADIRILGQVGNPGGHSVYLIDVTNAIAFTISFARPLDGIWGYLTRGQIITLLIRNTSGGAMGAITLAASHFSTSGALLAPANGNSRSFTCVMTGTPNAGRCVEIARSAADVIN